MKKIFNISFVITLFVLGVFITPSHKADAAVSVSVSASPSSVASGGYAYITWNSSGATACYRTDTGGSVALNDSTGFRVGPIYSTTTFSIRCTAPDPVQTTTSCFGGFYEYPDPQHPNGGTVTYTAPDGSSRSRTGLYNDDAINIEYINGTVSSIDAAIDAGACSGDNCSLYGGECSTNFSNNTICKTIKTKSSCQANSSCFWLLCAL